MPGRVAVGSSPMHQDTGFDAMGRPDPTRVEGLVAVLYLAGSWLFASRVCMGRIILVRGCSLSACVSY